MKKEVLFMAGSIFKINSETPSDSIHTRIIEFELCNNDAYELNPVYEKDIYIYSPDQNSPDSLTAVLLRMNLFVKAKKYYHRLLDERSININSFVDLIVNYY